MAPSYKLPTSILPQLPYRARLAFDNISGRFGRLARRLAGKVDWSEWRPGRPTILCLKRSAFISDVRELRRRLDFNFVELSAAKVKVFQQPWIAPEYRLQTFFYELLQTKLTWEREKLATFGGQLLAEVMHWHPIAAVLAGNTDYWQDEMVKLGCKRAGIPFLVLGRENYSVAIAATLVRARLGASQFRFNGDGVAVISKQTQDVMDESGCYPENGVWTTGAPRFDAWHGIQSRPRAERNLALLVNYADPNYLCPVNFREMLPIFVEEAKNHAGLARFAIKVKKGDDIAELLSEFPILKDAPVELVFNESLQQLYPLARVIVGSNSHAIVEALLLDCPLIVPWWADGALSRANSILCADDPADSPVAYYPRSPEAFREKLVAGIKNELEPSCEAGTRLGRIRSHIAFQEDGSTMSATVGRFLDHYIRPPGSV